MCWKLGREEMLVSRAGARRGFPGLIFGGSLHNHTRWTASAKPVSMGRHNTNSTLHSPRHCFSARCDSELAVSLLSLRNDCLAYMHTCEGCLICAFLLPRRQLRLSSARSASFELLVMLHLCFVCANTQYTISFDVRIHPSVVLQLLSRPPQWLAQRKSGAFSGGQLLLAS